MKRRDFNRFALGIGLSPILANAQVVGQTQPFAHVPSQNVRRDVMLELDDLQHILITRVPALTGRYEFLSFRQGAQGRAWLAGILDKVASVQQARDSIEREQRWVSVAFTWQGLRALGLDEQALATFPEEFRQGMVARAEVLGDTGRNHPDRWVGSLASPALHAIAILFARNPTERQRVTREHQAFLTSNPGVEVLSSLDLDGFPPFEYAHDHFGYRDRLSEAQIEGSGVEPTPGSGAPVKAGEFILGHVDESGELVPLPQPEILSRNGTFMAYRRLQEHVGAFRNFLRQHGGPTTEGQELIAAKLMGRWRSGAPLVLAPEKDDPALGADYQRNNNFNYSKMDPQGYAVPLGAHIRRMNPRDTAANIQRRRMIRRGATYEPPLPEGAQEDGVDRGIAAFVLCASLVRQFEFAQNVWINDPNFHELGNERDPFIGNQDGTFDMTIPKRPIRRKITGLPAFTTLTGGAYFLLPGIKALRYLAVL
jgi:Dyp-type peroxidase family